MEPVGPAGSVSWNLRAHDPDFVDFLYRDVDFFYSVAFYVTTVRRTSFGPTLSHLFGALASGASCQWHVSCVTRRPHSVEPVGPAESVSWLHAHVDVQEHAPVLLHPDV